MPQLELPELQRLNSIVIHHSDAAKHDPEEENFECCSPKQDAERRIGNVLL
jgi:hypothetical protein